MVLLRKFSVVSQGSVLAQDKQLLDVSNHFFKNYFIIIKPQTASRPSTSCLFFCFHLHHTH